MLADCQICMKFKILQINSTCNWGSTGVIAEGLGKIISLEGASSYIAYGRYCRKTQSRPIKIGNKLFILIHYFFSVLFDMHGLFSIIPTFVLINKIRKINPDIIHLHNIHGYYINYVILFDFLKRYGKPVVWTLHDCWAYTGHCAYYASIGCDKWKSSCYKCPNTKEYPKSYIDLSKYNYRLKRKLFSNVDDLHIVTVSDWLCREVSSSFLGVYDIRTIYNGVDINCFKPYKSIKAKICSDSKTLILGVANKWDNRKGLMEFIKLSQLLDDDYHIHLVGLSKDQISTLPLNNNLTAVTRTNSTRDLAELYSSADVYINLSLEETLGMTNIESMSCGTPVIVYNTTACPEVVGDGCGYVVEKHALSSIVEILQNKIRHKKHLYMDNCRNYVVDNFSQSNQYNKYIVLYNQILSMK